VRSWGLPKWSNWRGEGGMLDQLKEVKITVDIIDIFHKGGPAMWPLLALSILSISVILERLWFWLRILTQEKEIADRILDTATENWEIATEIAKQAVNQPIGRFLYAPLRLLKTDTETFRLALESTAAEEIAGMRQGEKVLESVIALSPLLGLFGTVLGLIQSLHSLRIGDIGTEAAAGVTNGIGTSLICTATGLVVAIVTSVFYRLFQGFVVNQIKVFNKAGNELELLYRQSPPDYSKRIFTSDRKFTPDGFEPSVQPPENNFSEVAQPSNHSVPPENIDQVDHGSPLNPVPEQEDES